LKINAVSAVFLNLKVRGGKLEGSFWKEIDFLWTDTRKFVEKVGN
jgi:hypothetical protein